MNDIRNGIKEGIYYIWNVFRALIKEFSVRFRKKTKNKFIQMYVPDLIFPGNELEMNDEATAFRIQPILNIGLPQALSEAAMSYYHYESNRQYKPSLHDKKRQAEEQELRRKIDKEQRKKLNEIKTKIDPKKKDQIEFDIELRIKREWWENVRAPGKFVDREIYIYAKSFLYSMDRIGKFLNTLCVCDNVPEKVSEIKEEFYASFPDLTGVRNSSAHFDQRLIGQAYSKPIKPKPVNNFFIEAPNGAMVGESLAKNFICSTMRNGHLGMVEISQDSLKTARDHIQNVIDAFEWEGNKMLFPSW